MLPDPKKGKIGSKTSNCMFIGYASNSASYRFLVLKSDVLESNTIIETENAKFFEHIFPLSEQISHTPTIVDAVKSYDEHVSTSVDDIESSHDELRRSKRRRKEVSFGDDFYTYLIENEPSSYFEASPNALLWKEAIKIELDSILKNQTWELVDLPSGEKPIGYKWIFKRKYFSDGSIEKYKARL